MDEKLKTLILEELEDYKQKAPLAAVEEFRNITRNELIRCHFGLGLYIRNTLIYPNKNNISDLFYQAGYVMPDDMSTVILEIWHDELNKKADK